MRNPTAKQTLHSTSQLPCWVTHNNTPGLLPVPNVIAPIPTIASNTPQREKMSIEPTRFQPCQGPCSTCMAIPSGAQQQIVTRHAINVLTLCKQASFSTIHTPPMLMKHAKMWIDIEHYANPMVHPITGRIISSYKKLMHDPATAEVWQTAFGKDFWGKAQGCNKIRQKGMNAMFVMTHDGMTRSGMLLRPRIFSHM
jgi:hypothetical protein